MANNLRLNFKTARQMASWYCQRNALQFQAVTDDGVVVLERNGEHLRKLIISWEEILTALITAAGAPI